MRMKVLGNEKVEIVSLEEMLKEFGSVSTYVWKDGVLYLNGEFLEEEKRRFGEHLSTKEIVEDAYREARTGIKKWNWTMWDELSKRHVKY